MAWVVWLTGLPGSGKSAIARSVEKRLRGAGARVKRLELDELRRVLTPQSAYSDAERDIVYAALAMMAKLLAEAGTGVIVDATANRRRYREATRQLVPEFAEVYVRCPLEEAMRRESGRKARFAPPQIYEKARQGAPVPGVTAPYEEPLNPELIVDTTLESSSEGAKRVADYVLQRWGVGGRPARRSVGD